MTSPWSSGQPQSSNGVLNPVVAVETQWTAVNTEDFSQHEELYVAEPDTVRTNGYEKKLNNGVLFFYDEQNRATFLGDIGRWNEVDASKVNVRISARRHAISAPCITYTVAASSADRERKQANGA
ncbi:hypothetical protein ONS96_010079 [Cadophora gregata f. sp. sojae]|nr:hypothetical protein ONS96_010079 [Cadophora gregata f. sp. sojae]